MSREFKKGNVHYLLVINLRLSISNQLIENNRYLYFFEIKLWIIEGLSE